MADRFLKQQPAICAALLLSQVRKSAVDIYKLTKIDISQGDDGEGSLVKAAAAIMSKKRTLMLSMIAS